MTLATQVAAPSASAIGLTKSSWTKKARLAWPTVCRLLLALSLPLYLHLLKAVRLPFLRLLFAIIVIYFDGTLYSCW